MKRASIFTVLLFTSVTLFAQDKLAILPFSSSGLDQLSVQTAESMLRLEITKISTMSLFTEKQIKNAIGEESCDDIQCAVDAGKYLNTDQVFFCKMNPLGEKIIVQYYLIDIPSGKNLLVEQTTALSMEDLENVMKRVAKSIVNVKPFAESVEVGNVTETESIESLRRASRYNFGLTFGYLFPQSGYDDDKDKSFIFNLHFDYELPDYAVGLMLGIRHGFAMNVYGEYLITKTDVCPYIGGAFGFHWVAHEDFLFNEEKTGDGFELTLNGGLRLFHTYNFQVVLNFEYIMTFNDYNDKAFVFTIGIL